MRIKTILSRLAMTAMFAAGIAGTSGSSDGLAEETPLRNILIGTGGVTGIYYPSSGAICRLINERRHENGLFCIAKSTRGSVENIRDLERGELQFAIVQADVASAAYEGRGVWDEQPVDVLRAVISLYPETVTVIAKRDAGIDNVDALRGKRVGIGKEGSGSRATWEVIENALGWNRTDIRAVEVPSEEQGQMLCAGELDAFVWFSGHPSFSTEETLSGCDANLISVSEEAIAAVLERHPRYRKVTIPADIYAGQETPVTSFGTMAELVTASAVDPEIVGAVTQAILEDVDRLRGLHPALKDTGMHVLAHTSSAPLHPGAAAHLTTAGARQ